MGGGHGPVREGHGAERGQVLHPGGLCGRDGLQSVSDHGDREVRSCGVNLEGSGLERVAGFVEHGLEVLKARSRQSSPGLRCLKGPALTISTALELEVQHLEVEVQAPGDLDEAPPPCLAADVDEAEDLIPTHRDIEGVPTQLVEVKREGEPRTDLTTGVPVHRPDDGAIARGLWEEAVDLPVRVAERAERLGVGGAAERRGEQKVAEEASHWSGPWAVVLEAVAEL